MPRDENKKAVPLGGEERLRRVAHYETLLDALLRVIDADEVSAASLEAVREQAAALERYYTGEAWRADLAADEAGLLPRELKRGVLSEDGIHNALEDYRELLADAALLRWQDRPIRLTTADGDVFEGSADVFSSEYGLHEYGREERFIRLGAYIIFEGEISMIEEIGRDALCGFYGAEAVSEEIRELYRDFLHAWCAETCAPRFRPKWSPDNPTWGQCSITSFIVQDLYGGKVYGVPLPEGGFHCYNVVGDLVFDLTSEQFGDRELDYDEANEQLREVHFADQDKRARYELLKRKLQAYRDRK